MENTKYRIIEEKSMVVHFNISASFVYQGKFYEAQGNYFNGGCGVDEVEVIWNDGEVNHYLDHEHPAFQVGLEILENMDINKDNIELF